MSENKKHPNAEFIIAFAGGKQLQYFGGLSDGWRDFQGAEDPSPHIGPWNCAPEVQWRIKPEQKWVRVALFEDGLELVVEDEEEENCYAKFPDFSHWLSDRLYYTPKEKA